MKHIFSIIAAAAAVVAGLIRLAVGDGASPPVDNGAAVVIPPMTPGLIQKLAFAGATDTEIADRFLTDEIKVKSEFSRALRVARALRRISLRGLQFDLARKLNGPSLIWLGRNELGQSLNPATPGEPLPETYDDEDGE